MIDLLSRIEDRPGGPVLRTSGRPSPEIVASLLRGDRPPDVGPIDLLASLAIEALGPEGSPGLRLLPGKSKYPGISGALSEPKLAEILPRSSRPALLALRSGLLQAFDRWDESHEAAQAADDLGDRDSAGFWHGIAHRREPDPGNAAYWFRRVGVHPAFEPLGIEARKILESARLPPDCLFRGGKFDPLTFIDLATRARAGSAEEIAARKIQRAEMRILLGHSAAAAGVIQED